MQKFRALLTDQLPTLLIFCQWWAQPYFQTCGLLLALAMELFMEVELVNTFQTGFVKVRRHTSSSNLIPSDMDNALAKTRESYGFNNAIGYPNEERFAGRPTSRPSPLHDKLVAAGAHMGFNAGWEVPLWYAPTGEKPEYKPSFMKANWQLEQEREYNILTQKVGVADLSPFGKFLLTGPDARKFLDRAVAGFVPKEGRTGLGHMLTSTGKVYAELTITGMEEGEYLIVTGGGSEFHDLRRLSQIAREEHFDVELENITEAYGTLTVAGPLSAELMGRISDQDVKNWKFMDAKQGKVGGTDCLGIRISYTGEL